MKIVDILKWIAVLPAAFVAWLVIYWVINLLYCVFSPVEMTQWAITIMSSSGSGMAFVIGGSWVAPKGRKIVSIVLATIMVLFALISLIASLYGYGDNSMLINILSGVSTIVGCVLGSIQIHKE